jgi:hypothetical protein
MMVAVFAALMVALLLDGIGRPRPALVALGLGFGLAVWLFLFEVYSPETGFRMPWLQGMSAPVPAAGA